MATCMTSTGRRQILTNEHVRHLQGLLRSWARFNDAKRDILELALIDCRLQFSAKRSVLGAGSHP